MTDNTTNFKAAWKILDKMPHIVQVPCAVHCINLMLEDIGKLEDVQKHNRGRKDGHGLDL